PAAEVIHTVAYKGFVSKGLPGVFIESKRKITVVDRADVVGGDIAIGYNDDPCCFSFFKERDALVEPGTSAMLECGCEFSLQKDSDRGFARIERGRFGRVVNCIQGKVNWPLCFLGIGRGAEENGFSDAFGRDRVDGADKFHPDGIDMAYQRMLRSRKYKGEINPGHELLVSLAPGFQHHRDGRAVHIPKEVVIDPETIFE